MSQLAVITGGSSGLGFAIAKLLGNLKYKVVILARNKEKIDTCINELKKQGIEAQGFSCDITKEEDLKKIILEIKQISQIDFLLLNAGLVTIKLLREYENTKELKHDLEIDLWGTIQSAYYFEPLLNKNAKVCLISSALGLFGIAGYSMYCAAKAGMINFAESWRRELLNKNINVYVACPGDIDTPQFREEMELQPKWMKKNTPRKVQSAEKVAYKIISKCKGKRRFMILPANDVKFLNFASKILPRKIKDLLLDDIFPKPL